MAFFARTPKPSGVTALDLGTAGFGLAHISRDAEGTPSLDVCEYRECGSEPQELPAAVAAAVREWGLRGTDCVCIPAPGSYALRQIERPPVNDAELREAARWAVNDLIDFNAADAVIDTFVIPRSESKADRPERIYVVAARKPHVDAAASLVRRAGLTLRAIDITELALRNVTSLLSQDERGVALMALGGDPGLLSLTRAGSLYLTRAIDAERDVLEELSGHDTIDLKLGMAEEGERVLEGFLLEVQRSMDYVEHQLGQEPISNLAIAPLRFPTGNLVEYMKRNLSINVFSLDVTVALKCREPIPLETQARCLPAIGAALRVEKVE